MVKVSFKPWQEIVIHETIEYRLEDLIKNRVQEYPRPQPLMWAEGLVFNRIAMPPTDDVIRDQLQGIIHFAAVEWAVMATYQSTLRSDGSVISVIDVSNNSNLRDVANEIKRSRAQRE